MASRAREVGNPMHRTKRRAGLIIRGHRGNPEVRRALVKFARWARRQWAFPIRVSVYLSGEDTIRARNGRRVSATFFGPYSRAAEPYIRVATGDFPQLRRAKGRNDALAAFIHSLCHELVHYQQWIATGTTTERGVKVRAGGMLQSYADFARTP